MFNGFETRRLPGDGCEIHAVVGGRGPGLLLLHGFPQTHVMWHRVAPILAQRFTVVAPDLRGYGDSDKPGPTADHHPYSKRVMASDQVSVMGHLGFERFAVAGHDRGARVAYRMALDHPDRVIKLALLDILPTDYIYSHLSLPLAQAYYHWLFFLQPHDLPERLIGSDPDLFVERHMGRWEGVEPVFAPEAMAEYRRCFRNPAAICGAMEDYRAAASIDLEHDRADAGRRVDCPTLVLWGGKAVMEKHFNVLEIWKERCRDARGRALDCGHYLAEEMPEETVSELMNFFDSGARAV